MIKMITLPIVKKYYDMILDRLKKEEYREIKPYYISRFSKLFGIDKEILKEFCNRDKDIEFSTMKFIKLRNGYSHKSPSCIICCRLAIGVGKEKWGAIKNKRTFILKIIDVMELKEEVKDK